MNTKILNHRYAVGLILLFSSVVVIDNSTFAGEITYPNDSFEDGQTLDAVSLNEKFNQIKSTVNSNNAESTLNDLSCISGQIAKWSGANWVCSANIDAVDEQFASSTSDIPLLNIKSILQSVTISAPGPGYVIVSFSANYFIRHNTGTADSIEIGISDSSSVTLRDLPSRRYIFLSSSLAGGSYNASVASHQVFTVPVMGTYEYFVLGESNRPGSAVTEILISNPATQAFFVPNR